MPYCVTYSIRLTLAAIALLYTASISASAEPYEQVYILPDETIETKVEVFAADKEKKYVCSRYYLGCAVLPPLSLYYSFDYINAYLGKSGLTGPGDSSAHLRYSPGSPAENTTAVLSAGCTIPTGGDQYADSGWTGLSFGHYEAFTGASVRWECRPFAAALSLQYRFRQGRDQDFASKYFFARDRLADDHAAAGVTLTALPLRSVAGYLSMQPAWSVWRRPLFDGAAFENGKGFCMIPVSCGIRCFFAGNAFVSFFYTEQLIKYEGCLQRSAGSALSLLF